MIYRILAELTFGAHFAFVLFAALGGLWVARSPRVAWLHLPAAAWAAVVVLFGWTCPLTPLENRFRRRAGLEGYEEGFLDHHLAPLLYPAGLTREHQILLGIAVLAVNLGIYLWILRRRGAGPPWPGSDDRRP